MIPLSSLALDTTKRNAPTTEKRMKHYHDIHTTRNRHQRCHSLYICNNTATRGRKPAFTLSLYVYNNTARRGRSQGRDRKITAGKPSLVLHIFTRWAWPCSCLLLGRILDILIVEYQSKLHLPRKVETTHPFQT